MSITARRARPPRPATSIPPTSMEQPERCLDRGRHGDREHQRLRHLYAHRRRAVDLHAGQQQCGRAGAQCRGDTERYVHRHDGRRHFEGRHHHHQRHQRRCSDQRRNHRRGGRGRRCCQRNAGHADRRPATSISPTSTIRTMPGRRSASRPQAPTARSRSPPPGCGPTRWTTPMRPCRRSMRAIR